MDENKKKLLEKRKNYDPRAALKQKKVKDEDCLITDRTIENTIQAEV